MAQADVNSAFEGKRTIPKVRMTHGGLTSERDVEAGTVKRRTIHLGEAQRHTTRGRVIAVSRRLSEAKSEAKAQPVNWCSNCCR
jgi:hypothetical protein